MRVKRESPAVPPVVIEMSPDEAGILRAIFQHIGGSPGAETPRGFVDRLDLALYNVGVQTRSRLVDRRHPHIIYLNNPEDNNSEGQS